MPTTQARPIVRETVLAPRSGSGAALAVLRIAMGLVFLWPFLDKLFGLGFSTTGPRSWVQGGSPTSGFLGHVDVGPFKSLFQSWAGIGVLDWLFMLALLGVGAAVLLGVGLRISAIVGTLLMVMMWIAEWPLARFTESGTATGSTNPLVDYHVIYALALIVLAVQAAGNTAGLGRRWAALDIVQRHPWLR